MNCENCGHEVVCLFRLEALNCGEGLPFWISNDNLVVGLEDEVARLRECLRVAGLQAFMRDKSPEEIAEHLRMVAESYMGTEKEIKDLRKRLRWALEWMEREGVQPKYDDPRGGGGAWIHSCELVGMKSGFEHEKLSPESYAMLQRGLEAVKAGRVRKVELSELEEEVCPTCGRSKLIGVGVGGGQIGYHHMEPCPTCQKSNLVKNSKKAKRK